MIFNDSALERLKQPVSENSFCGSYLKLERQVFRPLRNIYNEANSAARKLLQTPDESEIDELTEVNKESWTKLSDMLYEAFQNQTRDIELISWFLVSQVYIDPTLKGFNNGLKLLEQLVDEHWDELHPTLPESSLRASDEDGRKKEIIEFRANAFGMMTGSGENDSILYAPLSMVSLIGDITYFKYQSAEKKGECPKLREDARKYVQGNADSLKELIKVVREAIATVTHIYRKVAGYCEPLGVDCPNFSFVINHLDKILKVLGFVTGFRIEEERTATPVEEKPLENSNNTENNVKLENVSENTSNNVTQSVVQNAGVASNEANLRLLVKNSEVTREQVFEELQNISAYFRATEPHSPVSYLLDKAVRWGHLSLPELLRELITDEEDTRKRIFTVAGLDDGSDSSSGSASAGAGSKKKAEVSDNNDDSTQINW